MAEFASYTSAAYVPNYFAGTPSMDGTGAAGTAAFVSRGDHVHPSDTSRVPLGGGTMTGLLTLSGAPTANLHAATKLYVDGSAPVGGPYVAIANMHDVGRNLIHNPLFNVAQRGVGPFTANGAYTLDRWRIIVGGSSITISQQTAADANRAQIGDEAARFLLGSACTGTAGAGDLALAMQAIEDVRRLAGKTVTVSFWAAANTGTPKLGVQMFQSFGTGGSPSADVDVTGTAVTLSTTFTRYSVTIALPSVAGKTFGTTAGTDLTGLRFWQTTGATSNAVSGGVGVQSYTLYLWGVQLEVGSVATPLEKPDPRYDLANCQRSYQTFTSYLAIGYAPIATNIYSTYSLPNTMRATPTVAFSGLSYSNCSGLTSIGPSASNIVLYAGTPGAGNSNVFGTVTLSADL